MVALTRRPAPACLLCCESQDCGVLFSVFFPVSLVCCEDQRTTFPSLPFLPCHFLYSRFLSRRVLSFPRHRFFHFFSFFPAHKPHSRGQSYRNACALFSLFCLCALIFAFVCLGGGSGPFSVFFFSYLRRCVSLLCFVVAPCGAAWLLGGGVAESAGMVKWHCKCTQDASLKAVKQGGLIVARLGVSELMSMCSYLVARVATRGGERGETHGGNW